MPVYPAACGEGSQGQARPEGGQYRANGVDGVTEDQGEEPYPDDLVDEARGPG